MSDNYTEIRKILDQAIEGNNYDKFIKIFATPVSYAYSARPCSLSIGTSSSNSFSLSTNYVQHLWELSCELYKTYPNAKPIDWDNISDNEFNYLMDIIESGNLDGNSDRLARVDMTDICNDLVRYDEYIFQNKNNICFQ